MLVKFRSSESTSAIPNLGQYIHCADLSHSKDIQSHHTLAGRIGAMEKKEPTHVFRGFGLPRASTGG